MCTIMVTLKMELMKMGSVWKSRALLVTWPLQVIDQAIALLVYTQDVCVCMSQETCRRVFKEALFK